MEPKNVNTTVSATQVLMTSLIFAFQVRYADQWWAKFNSKVAN